MRIFTCIYACLSESCKGLYADNKRLDVLTYLKTTYMNYNILSTTHYYK